MRTRKKTLHCLVSGALAVVFLVLGISGASADYFPTGYIYTCQDTNACRLDPVNVIFDINGTVGNSQTHLNHHLGWTEVAGDPELFYDHWKYWEYQESQYGSGGPFSNRDHMRLNQGNDWGGASWGWWTMAPVHHEYIDWDCYKHVVDTYNGARDWVAYKFNQYGAHPAQGKARLGNTLPVDQGCKNIKVNGDGDYVWIDI